MIKEKLVQEIRKNKALYAVARSLKDRSSEGFQKLLWGYFEETADATTLVIEHPKNGDREAQKVIYYILVDADADKKWGTCGFCGILRRQLELLNYADRFGFVPVVRWGEKMLYYDSDMDSTTRNAFEYYFEPTSGIEWEDINSYCNISIARVNQGNYFTGYTNGIRSYRVGAEEIDFLANMYRKYMHLNRETAYYLDEQIKKTLGSQKKTLGVHIRGTDFAKGFKDHPKLISAQAYLESVKKCFDHGKYDQVFIATDDVTALTLFINEFGDSLVYYKDVVRSDSDSPVVALENKRPLHRYKLGLEVLRDIYSLVECDGLVKGLSGVSLAVQYIAKAENKEFDELIVLDEGINQWSTRRAKHPRSIKNGRNA